MSEYDLNNPQSDVESYLANMDGILAPLPLPPESNVEKYLAHIVGVQGVELPNKPDSRVEAYLEKLALDPPQPVTPILIEKQITNNGVYSAGDDNADGYSKVTVEVPDPVLDELVATVNGEYNPTHDGYSKVTVQVPDPVLETLSVTENGEYTPTAYGYSRVTVSVQPPEDSYQLKSITTPTPLATFEASAMPMPSLKVSVEAKQDLHGYDKPWVGGAGKNKLPMTVDGIKALNTNGTWSGNVYTYNGDTFTLITDADNNITAIKVSKSGTHTGTSYISFNLADFDFTQGTNYIINGVDDGASTSTYRINIEGVGNYYNGDNAIAGDGATHRVRIQTSYNSTAVTTTIYPMIRLSTESDATFAPYSNECPISGWDNANISDVGKNKCDISGYTTKTINGITYTNNGDGTISLNGTSTSSNWEMLTGVGLKAGTYILSGCPLNGSHTAYHLAIQGDGVLWSQNEDTGNGVTVTIPSDGTFDIIFRIANSGISFNNVLLKPMIRLASVTDPTFKPYINQITTISLGQTVYGGELDVVNGTSGNKLTYGFRQGFTRGALDSSGKLYKLSPILDDVAMWTDTSKASEKIMSNMFQVLSLRDARTATTPSLSQHETSFYVGGYVGDEATLDALLSDLQVKYELATPTTLTTQPTPIKSLNGQNNLSVDCGEVIEGEYFKAL